MPQAALGGVLLFVAMRIIRVGQIVAIYRQSLGEFLLILATAAAIIVLPIEQGVGIGIALSLLHGIWSTTRARLTVFERVPGTSIWWPSSPHIPGETEPEVIVAGFQAPLSFLNAYHFRRDVMATAACRAQTATADRAGGNGHRRDRLHRGADPERHHQRLPRGSAIDFAIARLESARAQDSDRALRHRALLGSDHLFQSVEEAIRARRDKAGAATQHVGKPRARDDSRGTRES